MKRILALLAMLVALATASAQPYWNNLDVDRLNKVQPHDCVIPDGQQWRMSLNGTWHFAFFDNPASATINPRRWDTIRVPGNMELQGYGVPVYVNMKSLWWPVGFSGWFLPSFRRRRSTGRTTYGSLTVTIGYLP